MATVGIKRLIINGATIQVKTGTAEYTPSGAEKTPVLDDGTGDVMHYTQERKAGEIKVELSTIKSADTKTLRTLDGGEIIMELLDGTSVVGQNMTQTANNAVKVSDGTCEYSFMGNVREL